MTHVNTYCIHTLQMKSKLGKKTLFTVNCFDVQLHLVSWGRELYPIVHWSGSQSPPPPPPATSIDPYLVFVKLMAYWWTSAHSLKSFLMLLKCNDKFQLTVWLYYDYRWCYILPPPLASPSVIMDFSSLHQLMGVLSLEIIVQITTSQGIYILYISCVYSICGSSMVRRTFCLVDLW